MARRKVISNKKEIFDAAFTIVDTDGVNALSIRHLSGYLNVSSMTLYNYIENIDEVKKEVILEGFRRLYRNGYEALLSIRKYDGWIRIDEGCRVLAGTLYHFGVAQPHLFELMFCTNDGKFRKDAEVAPFYGFFHNLLHRKSAANENGDNGRALNMLGHITNYMIIERIRGVNNTTEEDYFEHVNEYISKMF